MPSSSSGSVASPRPTLHGRKAVPTEEDEDPEAGAGAAAAPRQAQKRSSSWSASKPAGLFRRTLALRFAPLALSLAVLLFLLWLLLSGTALANPLGDLWNQLAGDTARRKQEATVGWLWPSRKHGGELHVNVQGFVAAHANQFAPGLDFLRLVAPEPGRCQCNVERWDQYAVCDSAWASASRSISLGVNGYDPFAYHVQSKHDFKTSGYDCFNTVPPRHDCWNKADGYDCFNMDFHPVCVSGAGGTIDGRQYTTLPSLLVHASRRSVVLKMDIEGSEWDVLAGLSDEDWGKISALHVEFHFQRRGGRAPWLLGCPDDAYFAKAKDVMALVRQHMAVIDGTAAIYGNLCRVGDIDFPQFLAVSYAADAICSAVNSTVSP